MVRDVPHITLTSTYRNVQDAMNTAQLKTVSLVESNGNVYSDPFVTHTHTHTQTHTATPFHLYESIHATIQIRAGLPCVS